LENNGTTYAGALDGGSGCTSFEASRLPANDYATSDGRSVLVQGQQADCCEQHSITSTTNFQQFHWPCLKNSTCAGGHKMSFLQDWVDHCEKGEDGDDGVCIDGVAWYYKPAASYTLIQASHYCNGNHKRLWFAADGNSNGLQQCAAAVAADAECSQVFYARPGSCACVRRGEECERRQSTNGNSIYSLQD